jgi:hypothetical protein
MFSSSSYIKTHNIHNYLYIDFILPFGGTLCLHLQVKV